MSCSPIFLGGMVVALGIALVLSFAGALGQAAIGAGFVVALGLLVRQWFPMPPTPLEPPAAQTRTREIPDVVKELARGGG